MAAEPKVGVMLRLPVDLYQKVKALVEASKGQATFTSVTIQALCRLLDEDAKRAKGRPS